MGYTTDFYGEFKLDRPLAPVHKMYLERFADTRRMMRSASKAASIPDPIREAVGLPIGQDAEYFVGGGGEMGQGDDKSVIDHNSPPSSQPGLWCQWVPTPDGEGISWDGGEKFYHYEEWLRYIINNFLKPWGYILSGSVSWQGEDSGDIGKITVVNNIVQTSIGRIVYE